MSEPYVAMYPLKTKNKGPVFTRLVVHQPSKTPHTKIPEEEQELKFLDLPPCFTSLWLSYLYVLMPSHTHTHILWGAYKVLFITESLIKYNKTRVTNNKCSRQITLKGRKLCEKVFLN